MGKWWVSFDLAKQLFVGLRYNELEPKSDNSEIVSVPYEGRVAFCDKCGRAILPKSAIVINRRTNISDYLRGFDWARFCIEHYDYHEANEKPRWVRVTHTRSLTPDGALDG